MPSVVSLVDLHAPMTQKAFGELVGIGQPAVSALIARGVLREEGNAAEWLAAYLANLQEQVEARGAALSAERTRLTREQVERVAMQNTQLRKEYAPAATLEALLAFVLRAVAERLDTLLPAIRGRVPDLQVDVLAFIEAEVVAMREAVLAARLATADELAVRQAEDDAET